MKRIILAVALLAGVCVGWANPVLAGESERAFPDPAHLQLASVNAVVFDRRTGEVLYAKNPDVVVPIASVSKLMTAMVVLDAKLPLNEKLDVGKPDIEATRGHFSRIRPGSIMSRKGLLKLALMSSENRAAASLARHYPGGMDAFVAAMNAKAEALGMNHSHFVEPTGLSQENVSTASDLRRMLSAAAHYPLIHEFTTTPNELAHFKHPRYALPFYNTNPLVRGERWNISVSKTGFTDDAGRCLVMLAQVDHRPLGIVLLDSLGKRTPIGDVSRIKRWLATGRGGRVPNAARRYAAERDMQEHQIASQ
ncbi:D-alanyl-D-alanine endopeptidase [Mangrovitalea sediminis]|uniref:D-alanyl-D-alanine endopeptidase n=1 Tax=Mangrovitalea sediminis TaxID=1982043 RepID=UPI000BE5009A|nr:D-alanyl-D-alanine endopeptidase [Mangrovitalea sediminis]